MRRKLFCMTLFGAALMLSADGWNGARGGEKPEPPPDPTRLAKGMSQAEVRQLLGPPKHIARQILYRRYLEQWVYGGPNAVRIEFDCVRGKEPQILNVQPLTPRGP